jgi:hypothetical protein
MKKQQINDIQDKVKIKSKVVMENEDNIIKILRSNESDSFCKLYEKLKKEKKVSDKVLKEILKLADNLDNRLFQGEFLEEFEYFTSSHLQIIESFILQRIYDKDCIFVSSLIECANFNNILSIYDICLEFIKRRRNFAIVSAALCYVFEHINFHDIHRIVAVFNRVLNNKKYYQNCQILASFFLFRITMNVKYFDFLKSLILEGGENNRIVLDNILNRMDYNSKKYFNYYDQMQELVSKLGGE